MKPTPQATPAHTPGPWLVQWDGDDILSIDGAGDTVIDYAGCGSHRIACSRANARLIAQAPALLAALERALDHPPAEWHRAAEHDAWQAWESDIRAAITAARGGAR